MVVKRFVIKGLFGYQDFDISFDNSVKILIGNNGVGKTTVLNTLYYILSKRFEKLKKINFLEIELQFDSKNKIQFSKQQLLVALEKPSNLRSGFSDFLDSRSKSDISQIKEIYKSDLTEQNKRLQLQEILKKMGLRINAPSAYVYDQVVKYVRFYDSFDLRDVYEVIDKNVKSKILYFPTFRRIEEDLRSIGLISKKEIKERYNYINVNLDDPSEEDNDEDNSNNVSDDDVIQFGMADVKQRIDFLTEEIARTSMIGFSEITGDLLHQFLAGFPNVKNETMRKLDLPKIQIVLERVGNSISEEDKNSILTYSKTGKAFNKELLYLLNSLIKLYNTQERYDIAIKSFVEVCNNYLIGKKYVYNELLVSLEIFRDDSNDKVDLNHLSSGEKQIVSLFSKIYLDLENEYIILFDEPELSLSLIWQESLLNDIYKSQKCDFLFAVTHSPFIFEKHFSDNTSSIEDYITKY